MSMLGKTIRVKGELRADEDITIEGRVEGPVWCDGCAVTIAPSGEVTGDVIARDITVFGRVNGQLVATEVVDVRVDASVTGRVVSERFILNDGARFNGRSAPQDLKVVLSAARFKQKEQKPATTSRVQTPSAVNRK
jgi:cytoskeletal protein CcmA (bactofilin family)